MIDIYWAYVLEQRLTRDLNQKLIKDRIIKVKKKNYEFKMIHNCSLCGQNYYFCICNLY